MKVSINYVGELNQLHNELNYREYNPIFYNKDGSTLPIPVPIYWQDYKTWNDLNTWED